MTPCTSKILSHQTLRCPVCARERDVTVTYAGYSVRFDCCKSWMVSGTFEPSTDWMLMPAIKFTWTEIKPSVRLPHYSGPDVTGWQISAFSDGVIDGFIIVDEYGDEVKAGGFWAQRENAVARLREIMEEEIEAREQHGPDHD